MTQLSFGAILSEFREYGTCLIIKGRFVERLTLGIPLCIDQYQNYAGRQHAKMRAAEEQIRHYFTFLLMQGRLDNSRCSGVAIFYPGPYAFDPVMKLRCWAEVLSTAFLRFNCN